MLDGDGFDSYIFNKAPKLRNPIYKGNNVYVMGLGFMVELDDSVEVPFRRQV